MLLLINERTMGHFSAGPAFAASGTVCVVIVLVVVVDVTKAYADPIVVDAICAEAGGASVAAS